MFIRKRVIRSLLKKLCEKMRHSNTERGYGGISPLRERKKAKFIMFKVIHKMAMKNSKL